VPTNVTKGNTAKFSIQFTSSTGLLATPSSGAVTIQYLVSTVSTSTSIDLSQVGSFWTAEWDSSPADLGTATWSIGSNLTTTPAAVGYIRVIDP
jgi:hypothetical protein